MKKIYLSLIALTALTFSATAQTSYEVGVANFAFTPSVLEVNVGDTVRWTNTLGSHSVNGSQDVFPNNPEGFGNEIAMAPWSYEFVFTIPGSYDFRCEQHPGTMTGSISVIDTTSGVNELKPDFFAFFPNPVTNTLSWKWDNKNIPADCTLSLFNIEGKVVAEFSLTTLSSYDVSNLSKGVYTYSIRSEAKQIQTGKLLIQRN